MAPHHIVKIMVTTTVLLALLGNSGCSSAERKLEQWTDNSSYPAQVRYYQFCPIPTPGVTKFRRVPKRPDLPGLAMPNPDDFAWDCDGTLYRWHVNPAHPDGKFLPYPQMHPWCRVQGADGAIQFHRKSLGSACGRNRYVFEGYPAGDSHTASWYDPSVGIRLYGNDASEVYADTYCHEQQRIDLDAQGGPFFARSNLRCLRAHGIKPPSLKSVARSIRDWSIGHGDGPSWSMLLDYQNCADIYQSRACRTMH